MMIAERIQALIHKLEVEAGTRWLNYLTLTVAVLSLAVWYDLHCYRNFASPEAMDAAQVARNLSEGNGFTTEFIRPFSLYLVQKHNRTLHPNEVSSTNAVDFARMHGRHPDLANAPVYPLLLAGLMMVHAPDWGVETQKPFWSEGGRFMRYRPEFLVVIFNQILLLMVVCLTFVVARKILDMPAAWLAALLVLGSDLLWKFSVSGLPTLLLMVILLGLVWCLAIVEGLVSAENPNPRRLFLLAMSAGLLTGLGMLTRYSFGWVIVPVVTYFAIFGGPRRMGLAVTAFLVFAAVESPWIARNLAVSGTLWGTAGYAVVEGTFVFPGSRLMQSLNPDITSAYWVMPYTTKFQENLRSIMQNDLLRLGGGWSGILFLAGLLLGLRNVVARRMRYFTMMCLGVFIIVSALGRTQLTVISPDLNTENPLVLLTPLVMIFGVAFFLTLLNQMNVPLVQVRYAVIGLVVVLTCQQFIMNLLPPKTNPIVYPPYSPPEIQQISGWMEPDELMMSDVPWAVAWYGHRQCVWLTLDAQDEFYAIHKNIKPVRALYLTPLTTDGRFVSEWMGSGQHSWGRFLFTVLKDERLPDNFPLTKMPEGFFPERIFLSNRDRWSTPK